MTLKSTLMLWACNTKNLVVSSHVKYESTFELTAQSNISRGLL